MYGTETLRWSYTGDAGEAIHQWPPEARHVIVPDEGHTYIGADHSQLEARIEAVYYNDEPSLEAFARGEDIHTANALDFFDLTETQWAALSESARANTRNYSKSMRYKMGFGGKAESESQKLYCPCPRCVGKVPRILDLTRNQKRAAEARWYAKHPAVLLGRRRLFESVKGPGSDHSWTSPFGYRRFFLEPASEAERSIYNIVTQHCAAEIVRRSMVRLHTIGAPIAIQMHDEIVLESPDAEVPFWTAKLREIMEMPVPELRGAIFPVHVATGKTWGAL
jgi:DNA polymerase-1